MTPPAVEIDELEFGWTPQESLLDLRRLVLQRGERVLLHGVSGSGKSSLLGLIGGVLLPRSGSVRLLGTELGALSPAARDAFRAAHVGIVFQLFNLLPYLPVLDNVLLAARFSPRRAARCGDPRRDAGRLLGALGLADPRVLGRPVTELSVGQQQRVAVARALLGRPEILVADEPTSALDADARDDFLALLQRECTASGTAVLIVSHDIALARHFDRSVSMTALNRVAPAGAMA